MVTYWERARVLDRLPHVRICDAEGCNVALRTQADNTRCRKHRTYAGRCCGDRACQYGSRRVF